jgi:phosphohistidine phosphatase
MKTLYLLRHAKSAWNDPDLDDHDRPLAPRGARAATLIGRHLRGRRFRPDRILCSTARRARDTLNLVLSQLENGTDLSVEYGREFYLAGDGALLEVLRRMPDTVKSVLLVGHNPGLQNLATRLAGSGDPTGLRDIAAKFPTGAFAELSFPTASWSDIGPREATLQEFVVPKKLS